MPKRNSYITRGKFSADLIGSFVTLEYSILYSTIYRIAGNFRDMQNFAFEGRKVNGEIKLWLEHGHEVSMCYSVPKLEGFSPRDEGHYNHRYRMHMF